MDSSISSNSVSLAGKSSKKNDILSILENPQPPLSLFSRDTEEDVVPPSPSIDPESTIVVSPKRKRTTEDSCPKVVRSTLQSEPPVKRPKQSQMLRGFIIGFPRDSGEITDAEKHAINDFIDKLRAAQRAATLPGTTPSRTINGVQESSAMFHNDIKYERKQTGHFAGKIVSNPTILTIDGEDYLEYRILTKPSF